jgi:hypothetical protein
LWWSGRTVFPTVLAGWALASLRLRRRRTMRGVR